MCPVMVSPAVGGVRLERDFGAIETKFNLCYCFAFSASVLPKAQSMMGGTDSCFHE